MDLNDPAQLCLNGSITTVFMEKSQEINFSTIYSYENILSQVNSKSFVYLDPPYIPLKQDSFTKYAKDDFSVKMHYDLNDFCNKLNGLDAKFMLSNSDTSKTREVYKAFNMNEILVNRTVGSSSKTRKKEAELIITNYQEKKWVK